MKGFHCIAFILIIIGAINWGLYGIFGAELSAWLGGGAGAGQIIWRIVFILVGLAGLVELFGHKSACKHCTSKGPASM